MHICPFVPRAAARAPFLPTINRLTGNWAVCPALEVDMKLIHTVCVACALVPMAAYAQSQPQPANPGSVQSQADQAQQSATYRFLREIKAAQAKDSCVGPVSYCTIFFGS
jgi:hypothetical protein